jgi:hypothetical protein
VKKDKGADPADLEREAADEAPPSSPKDVAQADDDESDDDESDDEDRPPARSKPPVKRTASDRSRPRERAKSAPARTLDKPSGPSMVSRSILLIVVGLAVGVAGGWFLREAKAKGRMPFAQSGAAASGVSAECKSWKDKICAESGEQSAGCAQAQSAADLLPIAACGAALEEVPATLSRLKEMRQVCDDLVTKLCGDLGKESEECGLVRRKTETIPPEGCKAMQENYPAVLAQLRSLQEQGAMIPGMQPGGPHGASGPAKSPH